MIVTSYWQAQWAFAYFIAQHWSRDPNSPLRRGALVMTTLALLQIAGSRLERTWQRSMDRSPRIQTLDISSLQVKA